MSVRQWSGRLEFKPKSRHTKDNGRLIYLTLVIYKRLLKHCYPKYEYVIMSRCQHGSPWPPLATRLYRPLLPGGLQGYILYRHRAVVYRFLLVALALLVHVMGSTGVCRFMSSSLLLQQCPACLVRLTWIVFVMGGRWPYSCCFVGCCLSLKIRISLLYIHAILCLAAKFQCCRV